MIGGTAALFAAIPSLPRATLSRLTIRLIHHLNDMAEELPTDEQEQAYE